MSIQIPHRFLDRLEWLSNEQNIQVIILGTFNPGKPTMLGLSDQHRSALNAIFKSKKYLQFNQVRNFYDRPQNRFWGVMDRLNNPALYIEKGMKFRNKEGLKYYTGANRDQVFQRQKEFCQSKGIFISDIVKIISTTEFAKVYNNFSDVIIEKYAVEFNTNHIMRVIRENVKARIIFNLNESKAIPNLSAQMARIKAAAIPDKVLKVPSTSGAAAGAYHNLVIQWKRALGW